MRTTNRKSAVFAATLICGIAIFLSALATPPSSQSTPVGVPAVEAQEIVLVLDPTHCKVHYTVDSTVHTVHGTFNLKSGTVHFDPESGKASGEIVVYATSGDSGNSSRDAKMHKEVLESPKYPDVVFRPTQVEGKVTRDGSSDVKLHGVMLLHGKEHEMVVQVHAELAADHWTGTTTFAVPYIEWGLKDPSNWLLKVKPVVNIELEMVGSTKSQK
jgi:polyisoprenoid-binding protein YceI